MKRVDKVYKALSNYSKAHPISAGELSELLGITRANASNDLNILVKAGHAGKTGTKPVGFFPLVESVKPVSGLTGFAEKNPSLVSSIEQAKAAVLYPPQRMHILLSGETGVGKSMFAELIHQFAVSESVVQPDAQLIIFNCADYANNPQLLTGNIFGVMKGAYTGADEDRIGLIEKADGGILFLDEIHRLPPETQEMLFTFIDNKRYRRLGETANGRTANVQIICATTEDIQSVLLQTFIRRIPMRIHLPNLQERGMRERLRLLTHFMNEEAHKLKQDIVVSMNSLRALLGYECINNIGQLKSDIQLLCARSYARFVSDKSQGMSISSYDLPSSIKEGLYTIDNRNEIWSLIPSRKNRFVLFKKDDVTTVPLDDYQETDIYQLIDQKLNDMEKIGLNQRAAMDIIDLTIKDYFAALRKKTVINEDSIINIVGSEIFATTKKLLAKASNLLQQDFSPEVFSSLAFHLFSAVNRLRNGETINNPRLAEIKAEHPLYFQAAQQCKYLIETSFSISLPEDEVGFMTLFFVPQEQIVRKNEQANVQVIVLAHGESTATSMADVVNTLLGNEDVVGFNMPLSIEPRNILEEVKAYLHQKITHEDVLLLVDMGSLTNFGEELSKSIEGQAVCIELVSTLHVLEASRKALLGATLKDITEAVQGITHVERIKEEARTEAAQANKVFIVTSCTTGEGSAQVVKDLLLSKLQMHKGRCEIRALQVTDAAEFQQAVAKLATEGNILYCIGTFEIAGLPYPQLSINQLLTEGTFERMQKRIDYELTFLGMIENIAPMLTNHDGPDLLQALKHWVENCEQELELDLSAEIMIGLICHLACVVDRNSQQRLSSPDDASWQNNSDIDEGLLTHIRMLEEMYAMELAEKEVRYICAYLLKKRMF